MNLSHLTYWLSIETQDTFGSFCLGFDPDASAVVEAKTGIGDFPVSVQDTVMVTTGTFKFPGEIIYIPLTLR